MLPDRRIETVEELLLAILGALARESKRSPHWRFSAGRKMRVALI
jgi:hypothetical protein